MVDDARWDEQHQLSFSLILEHLGRCFKPIVTVGGRSCRRHVTNAIDGGAERYPGPHTRTTRHGRSCPEWLNARGPRFSGRGHNVL